MVNLENRFGRVPFTTSGVAIHFSRKSERIPHRKSDRKSWERRPAGPIRRESSRRSAAAVAGGPEWDCPASGLQAAASVAATSSSRPGTDYCSSGCYSRTSSAATCRVRRSRTSYYFLKFLIYFLNFIVWILFFLLKISRSSCLPSGLSGMVRRFCSIADVDASTSAYAYESAGAAGWASSRGSSSSSSKGSSEASWSMSNSSWKRSRYTLGLFTKDKITVVHLWSFWCVL